MPHSSTIRELRSNRLRGKRMVSRSMKNTAMPLVMIASQASTGSGLMAAMASIWNNLGRKASATAVRVATISPRI